ncbi:MAG: peptidylprolyl isomerase, partial [Draconibacterium sp.]|nr:peptidylprolyl isomerase [Draconibacterium sp.]
MKSIAFLILIALFATVSCTSSVKTVNNSVVLIKTEFGEIKVKLYDDTPKHKENFIKLVNDGFYNDLLFHRVINHFMIQGGDPRSLNAGKNIMLGGGGPDYTLPAEIIPKYYHKKGARAAARTGNARNPERRSSGSQFYIIQGKVYNQEELDLMEIRINDQKKEELLKKHLSAMKDEIIEFKKNDDRVGFDKRFTEERELVDSIYAAGPQFAYTEEQRKAYTTIGGYPSLDGEYTIFGEVVEGLDVLDKIAAVETDKQDRPINNITM